MAKSFFIKQDGSVPAYLIIRALEERGGKNEYRYLGTTNGYYYINPENGIIEAANAIAKSEYQELVYNKEEDRIKEKKELSEKDKYDFVSGKFLLCIKAFGLFKQGHKYWLEYIGKDKYFGRSDNILNQELEIPPTQLQKIFVR